MHLDELNRRLAFALPQLVAAVGASTDGAPLARRITEEQMLDAQRLRSAMLRPLPLQLLRGDALPATPDIEQRAAAELAEAMGLITAGQQHLQVAFPGGEAAALLREAFSRMDAAQERWDQLLRGYGDGAAWAQLTHVQ